MCPEVAERTERSADGETSDADGAERVSLTLSFDRTDRESQESGIRVRIAQADVQRIRRQTLKESLPTVDSGRVRGGEPDRPIQILGDRSGRQHSRRDQNCEKW